MSKVLLVFIFLAGTCVFSEVSGSFESFVLSTRDPFSLEKLGYSFNRFRLKSHRDSGDKKFFKFILDLENRLGRSYLRSPGFQPFKAAPNPLPFDPVLLDEGGRVLHSRLSIYRAYAGLRHKRSTLTIGLQRLPLGVGRIWTPVDVFHPLDSFALEGSEHSGVAAVNLEYFPSNLSKAQAMLTLGNGGELNKIGVHYKSFFKGIDGGISFLRSREFKLLAYEAEANLKHTGIEVRSEGGVFWDPYGDSDFRGILGADYGFPGQAVIALEFFYNGSGHFHARDYSPGSRGLPYAGKGRQYLGSLFVYPVETHLNLSLLGIQNLGDKSRFLSASLDYTLGDYQNLRLGVMSYDGSGVSEYGPLPTTVFLNYGWFF